MSGELEWGDRIPGNKACQQILHVRTYDLPRRVMCDCVFHLQKPEFKAQPLPDFAVGPSLPPKPTQQPTKPLPFALQTEVRGQQHTSKWLEKVSGVHVVFDLVLRGTLTLCGKRVNGFVLLFCTVDNLLRLRLLTSIRLSNRLPKKL